MNLSDTEQLVFAYYLANGAQELNMVGRFWPYGELTMVIEDKVRVATRKFGMKAGSACPNVARAFLDQMIEREAFSTAKNKFGGTMHQYQPDAYAKCVKELQATNPIVQQAQAAGAGFWDDAFAALNR
jgi:hypothetical protein